MCRSTQSMTKVALRSKKEKKKGWIDRLLAFNSKFHKIAVNKIECLFTGPDTVIYETCHLWIAHKINLNQIESSTHSIYGLLFD